MNAAPGLTNEPAMEGVTFEEGTLVHGGLLGAKGEHTFLVQDAGEAKLVLRVVGKPPRGRRWAFNQLPYGTLFRVGRMVFTTAGGTRRTIRLRPHGVLPEPQPEGEPEEAQAPA